MRFQGNLKSSGNFLLFKLSYHLMRSLFGVNSTVIFSLKTVVKPNLKKVNNKIINKIIWDYVEVLYKAKCKSKEDKQDNGH